MLLKIELAPDAGVLQIRVSAEILVRYSEIAETASSGVPG